MLEHSAINSHRLCVGLGFSLHECKEADAEKLANLPRVIQQQVAQLSLGPPLVSQSFRGTLSLHMCVQS